MSPRNLKQKLVSIFRKNHLLSVNQLEKLLLDNKLSYNKTSIYRSLENLLAEGLICKHYFNNSEAYYELRENHHSHLFCKNCGQILTCEQKINIPQLWRGFKIDHYHLTLVGKCQNCL